MPVQPRIPDFDVFETLGATRDDSPEAIKVAWRRRVKEHHPDASGGSDEQIKRVNNVAYDWLRDPTLRQTYLLATGGHRTLPPNWDPDAAGGVDRGGRPPSNVTYEGPRADRITDLADRVGTAGIIDLLDLVHGYRPDVR